MSSPIPISKFLVIFALSLFIMLALACSQQTGSGRNRVGTADDGHGLHVVNNARLRGIMEELRRLDLERLSNEAALGRPAASDKLESVARAAASLAADARVIPIVYKNLEMSPESRRVFDETAAKLQVECDDLRMLARSHQPKGIKARLSAIVQTCNDCHASFRGPQMARLPAVPNPMS